FAYVLGIFECSSPHVLNEKVISFCQNNKRNVVNYIIYEKINGIVLSEFIIDKDEEVILNILTQLILALGVAYEKYEFTHYDLHSNNIIVRELDEEVEIKYTIEGKDYFVVTKYIPTIIDYGRSFIRVDGNPF